MGFFIIADEKVLTDVPFKRKPLCTIKVFDSSGKFLKSFSPSDDGWIKDVATDRDDNMYVLVEARDARCFGADVYVFDTQAKLQHSFRIRPGYFVLLIGSGRQ